MDWYGSSLRTSGQQVEKYGDRWFTSVDEHHPGLGPGLADQPLSAFEFGPDDERKNDEFEHVRVEALGHREHVGGIHHLPK